MGHLDLLPFPICRYKAVWLIFFMLGLGTLLPWNFFMTASQVRLREQGPRGYVHWACGACICTCGHRERGSNTSPHPPQYFINRLDQDQNTSSTEPSRDIQALATTAAPSPKRNSLSAIFNNVMTLCAMLPLLLFTCLNSFLHQK